MVVSASVASVRMRREFGDIETASCLLLCATRMHRVHHVQCGAAGVIGLLIAALTALTHADRPQCGAAGVIGLLIAGRGTEGLLCLP